MLTGAFLLGKGHSAGFTALSFAPPLSIRCAAWAFAAFGAAILCPIYHSRAKGIHLFLDLFQVRAKTPPLPKS